MQKYLLGIFLFSIGGSVAELFLLEHTEGWWQWLPIALMLLSAVVIIWDYFSDSPISRPAFRVIMVLFIVAGFAGIALHYKGNVEFELEMYPSMEGFELFWKTLKGATPVLAPGTMIALGLLGLLYTVRQADEKVKNNNKTKIKTW